MEKGSADETIFCSFATNKNVANPGEAGSSPNLAKMVVTGWLADRNERIITEGPPPPHSIGRQNFKPGSAVGIQSDPGSQG